MAKQRKSGVSASSAGDATARLKPKRTRKSVPRRECPSQRTSVYRGVTRHRWTGRFEAHLWDKNTWSETQRKKKGRQIYLGELPLALKPHPTGRLLRFVVPAWFRSMRRIDWLLSRLQCCRRVRRRGSGGARLRPGGIEVLGTRQHHPQLPGTHPNLY